MLLIVSDWSQTLVQLLKWFNVLLALLVGRVFGFQSLSSYLRNCWGISSFLLPISNSSCNRGSRKVIYTSKSRFLRGWWNLGLPTSLFYLPLAILQYRGYTLAKLWLVTDGEVTHPKIDNKKKHNPNLKSPEKRFGRVRSILLALS